ncbi:MAG: DUF86 domain-containing protein [Thermoanaerobaculia bacterium]
MFERKLKAYLEDILSSGYAILDFVKNINFEEFCKDRKTYSAVLREFEVIGEATKKIPKEILSDYPEIEWQDIIDFRNLLIHEYFGVDCHIVWNIIKNDLENLLKVIEEMLLKYKDI